jgi:pantoate--beta-alanine ligase
MSIPVIATVAELRSTVAGWRREGLRVALVPTMGALHDGHLDLVRRAASLADRTVVSIFVNPAQFAPTEDFGRYPRTLERDWVALGDTPCSAVYAPTVDDMYGAGFATQVTVRGPAEGLESVARPHFFAGVATVVTKLFTQCTPDIALFGEKDYQQLKVVTRLASDLDLGVEIVGAPTVREPDGLALSSRNAYLSDEERAIAPKLHATLADLARDIADGVEIEAATARARAKLTEAGFAVDYVEVRDAETLQPVAGVHRESLRALAAARLGATRLIDNLAVPEN